MNSFDDWWNGLVGFYLNSERAFAEIDPVNAKRLEPWMKACWSAAIEAAQKELGTEAYYWMDGREDYGPSYPEQQIEKLKVK